MNIRGIYKTSLLDFPGKICTVLFSGGCNLRCGFCHNPDLVFNSGDLPHYSNDEALALIEKRKNVIDGVTLSGGEPTLTRGLETLCGEIKCFGLEVKLDTNGTNPAIVASLLEKNLVDFVALDIKTSPQKYPRVTGNNTDFSGVKETVDLLQKSGIAYELRTTCVPGDVTKEDLTIIGETLGPVDRYFLQQYVSSGPLIDEKYRDIQPYHVDKMREMEEVVRGFAKVSGVRGI